jgi:hypothetical protein
MLPALGRFPAGTALRELLAQPVDRFWNTYVYAPLQTVLAAAVKHGFELVSIEE